MKGFCCHDCMNYQDFLSINSYSFYLVCTGLHLVQFPPLCGSMLTEKSRQLPAVLPVSEMCCVHVLFFFFFFFHSQLHVLERRRGHCDESHFWKLSQVLGSTLSSLARTEVTPTEWLACTFTHSSSESADRLREIINKHGGLILCAPTLFSFESAKVITGSMLLV